MLVSTDNASCRGWSEMGVEGDGGGDEGGVKSVLGWGKRGGGGVLIE